MKNRSDISGAHYMINNVVANSEFQPILKLRPNQTSAEQSGTDHQKH